MKILAMVVLSASMAISIPALANGIPTFDVSTYTTGLRNLAQMQQQVTQMRNVYNAMNGNRNIGSLLNDPTLQQYLPADMRNVYTQMRQGNLTGITGQFAAISNSEGLSGTPAERQAKIRQRQEQARLANRAMINQSFAAVQARLAQIDRLASTVDAARDPKAAQDLMNQIGIEQARIQNEMTKINLMKMLAESEQEMIAAQRRSEFQRRNSTSNFANGINRISLDAPVTR